MNYGEQLFNVMASTRFSTAKGTLDPTTWKKVANDFIQDAVDKAVAAAGGKKDRKKTPLSKMTEAEFWAYLLAEPSLAGIDIEKERGKCVFWCKGRGFQFTRIRFINWLNKADKSLSLHGRDANARAEDMASRSSPPPAGWQEFMRDKQRQWCIQNGDQYDPPGMHALAKDDFHAMPKDWRDECRETLGGGGLAGAVA